MRIRGWKQNQRRLNQKGQIVVEYVLLLVVIVGVAMILIGGIVSRDEDDPGFLIEKWQEINETIGSDITSGNSQSN